MKNYSKILRRIVSALAAFSMVFVMSVPAVAAADNKDFDEFLESEWRATMEDDYLSLHSSVEDYRKLGLTKPEVSFGHISYEEIADDLKEGEIAMAKLHEFKIDDLSERQQHDYLVYEEYIECCNGLNSYPDYVELFRPYIGTLTNIKDYLMDFPIYNQEDLDDYLTLIADIPRYMDEMLAFTGQQAAKGYFLDDASLDIALDEIDELLEKEEDNEFIDVFNSNVDSYEWLDDGQKAEYKEKNRSLVMDEVFPAYKKAGEELEKLRGSRSVSGSIYDYPDGKDYYTWLARYYCSSDASLQENFDFLTKAFKDVRAYYINLIQTSGSDEEPATISGLETLDEVIEYLMAHMEGFPQGPDIDYTLSYLDESVINEYTMAYYMQAPVDNIRRNIIRVNPKAVSDINTLYFTLAHEGFPGHLYQFTWYQDTGASRLRHDVSIMGYQEGWANYVERIMLNRSGIDRVSAESIACEEFLAYAMYAASDIAVNGLGYDVNQLGGWLREIQMSTDIAQDLFDNAVETPGMYLPYGYGSAKMWGLREQVHAALGDSFDEEEYHRQILENGPRQFGLVEEDLRAYVESKGGQWPENFSFFANDDMTDKYGEDGAATPDQQENMAAKVDFAKAAPILLVLLVLTAIAINIPFIYWRKKK
ncbi:MAG: DUF885 domain-containing protein [Mogibacterium sp.]|nr:DUF885 domain-containing protein [Mogibacterium sp.]